MAGAWRRAVAVSAPAVSGTAAGGAIFQWTGDPDLALRFAGLAGGLTVVTLLILVAADVWTLSLDRRPEHRLTLVFARLLGVVTGDVTPERRKAALAALEKVGPAELVPGALEAMRISRAEDGLG